MIQNESATAILEQEEAPMDCCCKPKPQEHRHEGHESHEHHMASMDHGHHMSHWASCRWN